MNHQLISICIPTYNGSRFLQESLNSVLSQSYKNIEVIISDDGSADTTLEICKKFKENAPFPVHIYNHRPSGIGANWNFCIQKANGKYIKLLFQDDILEPECVTRMMDYICSEKLDIVICKRKIIDENSDLVKSGEWFNKYNDLQKMAGLENEDFLLITKKIFKTINYNIYSAENFIGEPCVSLFSKKSFRKVRKFSTHLKQALDYEYWLRCLEYYNIGIIGEELVQFRFHSNQASSINHSNGVDEGKALREILFKKFLFYIDRKQAKYYIKQKFPLIKKMIILRYKLFP